MSEQIWVTVRDEVELTPEEYAIMVEACKRHHDFLCNNPAGSRIKADILLSAAKKLGFYSD